MGFMRVLFREVNFGQGPFVALRDRLSKLSSHYVVAVITFLRTS
jgi:hypothetical protein